jgi:hypothetical protein
MEAGTGTQLQQTTNRPAGPVRQIVRFALHLAAVYFISYYGTMWFAAAMWNTVLPVLQRHPPTVGAFQFTYSHVFIWSFVPCILIGFLYSQWFRHRVALLVWLVPLAVLAFKFFTFRTSVFESRWAGAFHEYFAGGFVIPEFHSYEEMFQIARSNPDMLRGLEQIRFTGRFYGAVGYALGALLAFRLRLPKVDAAFQKMKPKLSDLE